MSTAFASSIRKSRRLGWAPPTRLFDEERKMSSGRVRTVLAVPLVAGLLAGCGSSDKKAEPPQKGAVVRGETETGMKMTVDTFLRPADDPMLQKLDAYRAKGHYPAVDYHRITADNTAGQVADQGREVTFAKDADAIATGQGVETRFTCDLLRFEWVPLQGMQQAHDELTNELCKNGPPKANGIAPGQKQVYYVITDRSFGQRGIRNQKIFGPRSVEFTPAA